MGTLPNNGTAARTEPDIQSAPLSEKKATRVGVNNSNKVEFVNIRQKNGESNAAEPVLTNDSNNIITDL